MAQPKTKVFYLDGIRGLAAFCVFLHHYMLAFYPAYYTGDIKMSHTSGWDVAYGHSIFSFLTNGHFCVCIFFVLSGFVLSRGYFEKPSVDTLTSAASRRFLRLYIPVAVTLVIAYLLVKLHLFYNVEASHLALSEWWMGYMWVFEHRTTLFIQSLLYKVMFLGDNAYVTSLWTLSLELYGSMLVFAFLALTHNTRNRFVPFTLLACVLILLDAEYYTAFLLGISLNYFAQQRDRLGSGVAIALTSTLIIGGLLLGSYPSSGNLRGTIFEHTPALVVAHSKWIHIVAGFLLVLAVTLSSRLQWFFSLRLMRFMGYISFSIYLLHPLVIGSLSSFVLIHLVPHLSYNIAMLITTLCSIAVAFVLSYIMAKYIDAAGMRYARLFYEKYFERNV